MVNNNIFGIYNQSYASFTPLTVFPFTHSVARELDAIAEPQPNVLNLASTILPSSSILIWKKDKFPNTYLWYYYAKIVKTTTINPPKDPPQKNIICYYWALNSWRILKFNKTVYCQCYKYSHGNLSFVCALCNIKLYFTHTHHLCNLQTSSNHQSHQGIQHKITVPQSQFKRFITIYKYIHWYNKPHISKTLIVIHTHTQLHNIHPPPPPHTHTHTSTPTSHTLLNPNAPSYHLCVWTMLSYIVL